MTGYIDNLRGTLHLRKLASTQGWKEDFALFVYSNKIYTAEGDYYEVERNSRVFKAKGSVARWADITSILNEPGSEAHCLSILMAFAAPLIPLAGIAGITATPYGLGACDRQAAINWMLSVWGDPELIKMPSGEDNVSRIERYGAYKNLPITISEDDMTVAEVIKLSNEFARGTARATRFQGDPVPSKNWSSILVIPCRDSVVDRVDGRATIFSPILDYEVTDSNDIDARWPEIKDAIIENHGAAGDAYARWIVMNVDLIRNSIVATEKKLWTTAGVRGDYRKIVALVACLSVAGKIAKLLSLIKFEPEPAIKTAMEKVRYVFQKIENPPKRGGKKITKS